MEEMEYEAERGTKDADRIEIFNDADTGFSASIWEAPASETDGNGYMDVFNHGKQIASVLFRTYISATPTTVRITIYDLNGFSAFRRLVRRKNAKVSELDVGDILSTKSITGWNAFLGDWNTVEICYKSLRSWFIGKATVSYDGCSFSVERWKDGGCNYRSRILGVAKAMRRKFRCENCPEDGSGCEELTEMFGKPPCAFTDVSVSRRFNEKDMALLAQGVDEIPCALPRTMLRRLAVAQFGDHRIASGERNGREGPDRGIRADG